ncbi:MAG: methylmalonyl-CoA mutase [Chloroflexota bacterium]|nr:MAG: methylmalonyl-CoA mutase [Chloroflexota bacterium]
MEDARASQFATEHDRWECEVVHPLLSRTPERQASFETPSGIPIERVHGPRPGDYARDLGFPGAAPFTRGVQPTMYRGRFWTMRQYAGFGSAAETNARFRFLLDQGQTGLSVAFDLPTQIGLDPDSPEALGEIGKVGVSIASLADMEELLAGLPLDRVTTSMTINSTAIVLLALYVVVARKNGVSTDKIGGTVQNDILKEYIARGTYIFPPAPSMRLAGDVMEWCARQAPRWNPISVSGYHIREAGSTAVQEVAFTLGNGLAYVEELTRRGIPVETFAPRISFFFNAHSDLFEEVAKYRAARRLWARLLTERFGTRDPRALALRFHAQTAGSTLTAQQADVNVVRTTIEALAAVMGGCQSLHTNGMDEALGLPTEQSARLALRTQQVIAHESGVANTADPLGGSYYVEYLTDEIESRARTLIEEVDRIGGPVAAIERGYQAARIHASAYEHEQRVNRGERVVVGVNSFVDEDASSPEILRVQEEIGRRQIERVIRVRRERDAARARRALDRLTGAARGSENLVDPVIEAVDAYATIGEIRASLETVFGQHHARGGL